MRALGGYGRQRGVGHCHGKPNEAGGTWSGVGGIVKCRGHRQVWSLSNLGFPGQQTHVESLSRPPVKTRDTEMRWGLDPGGASKGHRQAHR